MHGIVAVDDVPSRFLDELPPEHVEVMEARGGFSGGGYGYGTSRFDEMTAFTGSSYTTPGWQRAQARKSRETAVSATVPRAATRTPLTRSCPDAARAHPATAAPPHPRGSASIARSIRSRLKANWWPNRPGRRRPSLGDRVFHIKFGNGNVTGIDGNKLTIQFDKAGEKRVVDSFVQRA